VIFEFQYLSLLVELLGIIFNSFTLSLLLSLNGPKNNIAICAAFASVSLKLNTGITLTVIF